MFVPKTVAAETEWVLRSAYGPDREPIARALRQFLGLVHVVVEDPTAVAAAIDAFAAGMDLADALHLTSSRGAQESATFDQALRQSSGSIPGAPPVIEP